MNRECRILLDEIIAEYSNENSLNNNLNKEILFLLNYIIEHKPLSKDICSSRTDKLPAYTISLLQELHKPLENRCFLETSTFNNFNLSSEYEDKRIKRIIFHDFRSVPSREGNKRFVVDFIDSKRKTTSSIFLVGRNGVGKTTIFDALEYIYTGKVSSADLRGIKEDDVKKYLTFGMDEIEGRTAMLEVRYSKGKDNVKLNISELNKDVFPSAMFISEYDFYQFQKVRNSVEKFVLEQLGYAKIVEFKENLKILIESLTKYKAVLEAVGKYRFLVSPYFELVVQEIISNKKNSIDIDIINEIIKINKLEGEKERFSRFDSYVKSCLEDIKKNAQMFYIEWNKISGVEEVDNAIIERLYSLYQAYVSVFLEKIDNVKTAYAEKEYNKSVNELNYIYKIRQELERDSDIINLPLGSIEKFQLIESAYSDILNKIDNKIATILKTFKDSYGTVISNVLQMFAEPDESHILNTALDAINMPIKIKNNKGEFTTFPQQYYNTFRYKVYIVLLKFCLALEYMKRNKIVLPIVIDDVFLSSDFEHITQLHSIIETIFTEYHKRIYKGDDEQIGSNIPIQLIVLTLDEKMIHAVNKGFDRFSRTVLKGKVAYPHISGRLFSYKEHEILEKKQHSLCCLLNCLDITKWNHMYTNLYK